MFMDPVKDSGKNLWGRFSITIVSMGFPPGGIVRGVPVHRTILVWICILSLAFAGCAANRTEIPVAGSFPEIIHVIVVIPTDGIAER
jgi:hypothetical protein